MNRIAVAQELVKLAKLLAAENYDKKLIDAIERSGKINGWEPSVDSGSGGLVYTNDNYPDTEVWATPFWEDSKGIPVSVLQDATDVGGFDLPLKSHDVSDYVRTMKQNWSKIMRIVEKAQK